MSNYQAEQDLIPLEQYLKLQQEFAEKEKNIEERLWLDANVSQFDDVLRSNYDKSTSDFSKIILDYIAVLSKAYVGVSYVFDPHTQITNAIAGYACVINKLSQQSFQIGEGIIGQAIESKKMIFFEDLPAKNIEIKSSTLNIGASSILIVPLVFNDKAFGVIELIFLNNIQPKFLKLLEVFSRNAAAMLESITINELTKKLLQQTQENAESLGAQEEELRQNMEELQATQEGMQIKAREVENRITAINNSGVASVEFDLNTTILEVNDAFLEITGYSREEVIGNKHKIFVDEKFVKSKEYQIFWDNLRNGLTQAGEFKRFTKDGKEIYLTGGYTVIKDIEGTPVRVLKLVTDSTQTTQLLQQTQKDAEALRAQEEELRQNMEELQATQEAMEKKQKEVSQTINQYEQILEGCVDSVISIDEKGIISFFNSSAQKLFGYHLKEVLGQNVKMLMPTEHSIKHDNYLSNYNTTKVAKVIGSGRKVEALTKKGKKVPILLTLSEAKLENGASVFTAFIKSLEDMRNL